MKVIHVSQSDLAGGASIASYRLHTGLLEAGISSGMLVGKKISNDSNVSTLPNWHRIPRKICKYFEKIEPELQKDQQFDTWNLARLPRLTARLINNKQASIVQLHEIDGLLGIPDIAAIKAPVVWTAHDEWASSCGYHFLVPSDHENSKSNIEDLKWTPKTRAIMSAKMKHWHGRNITIVCPSKWLAKQMSKAPHFYKHRIEVIPYGLGQRCGSDFSEIISRKKTAKAKFGIHDSQVITYGASNCLDNYRKGDDLFFDAIQRLYDVNPDAQHQIIIFGDQQDLRTPELPFPILRLGNIQEESKLSEIYLATDCFVCPSRADNLPNTVMEALSHATPCAGFRIGGVQDMIIDGETGYLAEPFSVDSLANAISRVVCEANNNQLSRGAMNRYLTHYTVDKQAQSYIDLYSELSAV